LQTKRIKIYDCRRRVNIKWIKIYAKILLYSHIACIPVFWFILCHSDKTTYIEDGLINDRKRSRLFARIFNRIGLSSCNERARVAYIRIQMVVSFRMRHFLVYTTCLRYQRIEERVLKVGIDGRHTRYACHIVPGIDYNYGESIVHR